MSALLRRTQFITASTCVRLYSSTRQNHYDVLRVNRNCTDKEIKDAFFKLSKQYHPDKNKDPQAHEHFVRITEAYNVLSKRSSREQYDCAGAPVYHQPSSYVYRTHVPYNLRKNQQYSYYYETNTNDKWQEYTHKAQTNEQEAAPTKRFPNFVIVLVCFSFASVGLMLQMWVIRRSFFRTRHTVDEKSKAAAEELEKVRNNAVQNGNEMQTRILLDRIVTAANPSVATAALGQALASEKKHHSQLMKTYRLDELKSDAIPSKSTGEKRSEEPASTTTKTREEPASATTKPREESVSATTKPREESVSATTKPREKSVSATTKSDEDPSFTATNPS